MIEFPEEKIVPLKKKGCNNILAVFNIIITAVGVGILSLPAAIGNSGWLGGAFLIGLGWSLTNFMMYILAKCMTIRPGDKIESYEGVGKACFGRPGALVVSLTLYGGLSCICTLLLIVMGHSMRNVMKEVTPDISAVTWSLISAALITPLTWLPSLKEVGITSFIGILAVAVVVVCIIITCIQENTDEDAVHEHDLGPVSASGFAAAFTNVMNSYTSAPIIIPLVCDMAKPQDFPKVAIAAFAMISFIFGSIGLFGYLGFGSDILNKDFDSNIANAIDAGNADKFFIEAVQIGIIVLSFSHYIVMFAPVSRGFENIVLRPFKHLKYNFLRIVVCRTLLMIPITAIAMTIPKFHLVVTLLGSTIVMFLQIIFPITFFLVLTRQNKREGLPGPYKSRCQRLVYHTIFVLSYALAIFGLILGTYQAIAAVL